MATKAKKKHTKKPLGFLVGLFCVAAFVMVFIGQENKLSAIEEEQAALSQEYEALELEKTISSSAWNRQCVGQADP